MNTKIEIKNVDNKVLYKGNIMDIPIKEDVIIQKSIEVFDDDDPCIIHRSYVVKEIVSNILNEIKISNSKEVKLSDYKTVISCIDIHNIEDCILCFI